MTARAPAAALAALAALAGCAATAARAEVPVPPLTGPVVDTAGLLRGDDVRRLETLARSARARENGQGVQLQYLIVRSLEGEPIEDYSIRVAEAWKLGSKERDDGLLVTVAVEDRRYRIEVGGGLEGEIPDALARRVGERHLPPAFRAGRYADGLYDAGAELLTLAGVAPEEVQQHVAQSRQRGRGVTGMPLGFGSLFALFVVIWIVSSIFRGFGPRRRRHLWWGGGPWIGGGGWGGGGFGGGGGWSGGGGGFSGGGASGRW